MLRLYAGRENIDKERFIYDNVRERGTETLVLVPNQYTLAAEEQALKYLKSDCLFDVEVLSMNRLGLRVLSEQGRESVRMLDKYGRFMLLTALIKEHEADFNFFRHAAGKLSFTSMLSDFISEFKQQNCSKEDLESMADAAEAGPMLSSKIRELSGVIRAYEEAIEGMYTDPEDYISMYVDAIKDSDLASGKQIWIYGYDSITPKFANAMMELAKVAEDVNFIVNRSDFGLDERLVSMLRSGAEERGMEVTIEEIAPSYITAKSETIERIERGLWADMNPAHDAGSDDDNTDFDPEDLTLVCAANPYYEAENAAVYVWHLIRDLGYEMRDIQLIANDDSGMQPIVRRVFAEYGLPVFSDSVRDITDTAAVSFIVNLLRFEIYNRAPQFLFAMLKSGMSGYGEDEIEELENYVRNYHIKGSMWDRDFKYGAEAFGEDKFSELNKMRDKISRSMKRLRDLCRLETVSEFVQGFKIYLNEEWQLDEMVEIAARDAEDAGFPDEAQRLTQSFDKAIDMLDQIIEIMGSEKTELAEFTELYVAGLTDVEVGVIPAARDMLSLGTMIRTRPAGIKACVVMGACEGVLPMDPSTEGLFSVDEKDFFKSRGFALGTLDDIRIDEENAAMYRMMAGPTEKLYISYSLTGTDGRDASPSQLIYSLSELFPQIEEKGLIERDVISKGWSIDMMQTADDGLRHLALHIKDNKTASDDDLTQAALSWYCDNMKDRLNTVLDVAGYDNDPAPLGRGIAADLFAHGDSRLSLSSSKLSTYSDCPFKYFVSYGLRPSEERDFSTDSRSIGDAYHECLMAVAGRLLDDREMMDAVNAGDDVLIERLVTEELDRLAMEYRGGLFISAGTEKFRLERIREICAKAAKAMAAQLGAESVTSAEFEESFGRHGGLKPVHIKTGDGEIYVEGRIDRADYLDVEGKSRVRVVDYKTGRDSLDLWNMRNGLRMQLMIYLISATSGDHEPAGMFYFNIKDPIVSMNKKNKSAFDKLEAQRDEDLFKLKGVYIDESGVLDAMPRDVLGSTKDKGLGREDYEELKGEVMSRIKETGEGIMSGRIGIHPLRTDILACNYCSYKSICRRDGDYDMNYARLLPEKPGDSALKEDAGVAES